MAEADFSIAAEGVQSSEIPDLIKWIVVWYQFCRHPNYAVVTCMGFNSALYESGIIYLKAQSMRKI